MKPLKETPHASPPDVGDERIYAAREDGTEGFSPQLAGHGKAGSVHTSDFDPAPPTGKPAKK